MKTILVFLSLVIILFFGMQWDAGNPGPFKNCATKEELDRVLQEHFSNLILPLEPEGKELQADWSYTKGDKQEQLKVEIAPENEGIRVSLPHRVLEPNTALWYSSNVEIPETQVWKINADDGCQLFLEGKQVFQYHEGGYFLLKSSNGKKLDVKIRVLNNAMHGGLRQIKCFPKDSLDQFFKMSESYVDYLYALEFYKDHTESFEIERPRFEFNKDSLDLNGLHNLFMGYPVLTQPLVAFSDQGNAIIRMKTFSESQVELEWGSDGLHFGQKLKIQPNEGKVQFEVSKSGANPMVFYRIKQENSESGIFSFKYPPSEKDDFSFTVWGDSQGGWETFGSLVEQKDFQKGDFFIGLGDLVNEGCDPLPWFYFTKSLKPALKKGAVMLVPGNHDYDGYYDELVAKNYHEISPHSNYFLRVWGNSAFLAMDLNEVFPLGFNSKQDSLFKKAIQSKEWRSAQWHFLLVHQPVHSKGWPGYQGEPFLNQYLSDLFESAEIDFVLSGHTHDYERLSKKYGAQRTHFIITGGGGGGIEPLDKE
ncbi:MAG: metallophosphoesterase [Saprospiraceae bacterium]